LYTQKQTLYKISISTGKMQIWSSWSEGAKVLTQYGQQNGKMQISEYTAEAKNVGRANSTTSEEQAVVEVEAQYKDQIDNKHYRLTEEEAQALADDNKEPRKIQNYKDHGHKMSDILYSTVKKNGSRACILDGQLYSKIGRPEEIKVEHLRKAVEKLHEAGVADFDSEVYAHGLSLQRIRSAWLKPVKTEKEVAKIRRDYKNQTGKDLPYDPNEDAAKLKFHVFDIPDRTKTYTERVEDMQALKRYVNTTALLDCFEFIFPSPTKSKEERLNLRDIVVQQGYEGLVHYEPDGMYEFGKRSSNCMKDKPRYDSEALVTGVEKCKDGSGKLLLKACNALDNVVFKCMMKKDRRDGKSYPRDYETMLGLIGKWITFSYEELSDGKNCPTKPVGEEVRECDNEGNPLQ
jgi:hypothetical protein